MRERKTHRWLSLLLAVVMVLSLIPSAALAARGGRDSSNTTTTDAAVAALSDEGAVYTASSDDFYKIVHVDAGRKYFSPENIKKIIDNAAAAGFNQVELYLSDNQGFRFALDDMNVTTSTGNTYDLTPALGDGYSDGSKYPDGSGKYLTQSEMTDIISYATGKGIDIVPCINVPGHMGAILEAFTQFKYSGSNSSIDLENAEAVAFALAITEKYAAYFQSQGVKYYNLGADEYANDLSTMGFQGLYTSGKYQKFVDFLNSAAQIVINHSMTPRAFNDGIYYNENNTYSINSAIQVCYWSCGWSGYNLASAQYLVNQEMDVINTHGDYYWVLGNSSWQCTADKASQFDYTSFQYRTGTTGNGTISDPAGAMFCIWCDVGNADGTDGGTAVVSATADVIAAFGAALPASEGATVSDNGVFVTAPGLTGLTVAQVEPTYSEEGATVVGYDITPFVGDKAYTGGGTVEMPVPKELKNLNIKVYDVQKEEFLDSVTVANGVITFTASHFSVYYVVGRTVEVTENETITVTAGQTNTATISDYNFAGTYTTEDSSIATVEVTGTDATEATTTYTQASVTCNTLISSNSNNWTAVSGYYYKADDGNYYPVYAQRSSVKSGRTTTYTYTWGYSTTSSTSNVTQIGRQSTTNTSTTPNITVYTKSGTDGTPASTTVTFTGVTVGTTYVTVGNTRYTINVVKEDLSQVTPLTVEFWITNSPVDADDLTEKKETTTDGSTTTVIRLYYEYPATTQGVYSESGILFSKLVPTAGTVGDNTAVFWKGTRLASDNKQTTGSGEDKTNSGTDFTYIRYWEGSWAYSADGETWTKVVSGDQIVAYYLQVTEVTDEVTTQVVDWGPQKDEWSGLGYLGTSYVLLDFAVVYESGEKVPASFPVDNSLAFHCDTSSTNLNKVTFQDGSYYYRHVGLIKAEETADYEVYMITLTPSSDNKGTVLASTAAGNTSYSYSGTEKVVWVDDEANLGDFADKHYTDPVTGADLLTVGGEATVSELKIYRQQGMLVTYYVRAKVTEDSLSVHYIDQTVNQEFYSYNIAVKSGTLFNEGFALNKGSLVNNTVTNLQGNTQTVSADLSTMPAIGAQYRYSDYTCVKVERSEDGKDVYLYYEFNNTHSFVIDFGLSVKIDAEALGNLSGDWTSVSLTGAKYGTVENNTADRYFIYTPNQVLLDVETLQLTLTGNNGSATHQIYIYPASNVLYEETFMTAATDSSWEATTGTSAPVPPQTAGTKDVDPNVYGYDDAYKNVTGSSGSTYKATVTAESNLTDALSFTFKGTGFDLIGTCGTSTGTLLVKVADAASGALKAIYVVNTAYADDAYGTIYQVPLVHTTSLDYGTYTVEVNGAYVDYSGVASTQAVATFGLDDDMGVSASPIDQIYSMLGDLGVSYQDYGKLEFIGFENVGAAVAVMSLDTDTNTYSLPDTSIGKMTVEVDAFRVYDESHTYDSNYKADEQVVSYVNVLDESVAGETFTAYVEGSDDSWTKLDGYEANGGPQKEVYLGSSTDAIAFKVGDATTVQISARAVGTDSVTMKVNGTEFSIASNTEMYYTVTPNEGIVTITNTGTGLLALGNLKLAASNDPGSGISLMALTEDEIVNVVPALLRMAPAPVEPEEPEEPEIPVFTPDKLDIKVKSTNVIFNKLVTVTITASTDVAKLTVNGKELKPTNSLLVKLGWSKTYTYVLVDTVKKTDTKDYEIIAYDAGGVASETHTVQG